MLRVAVCSCACSSTCRYAAVSPSTLTHNIAAVVTQGNLFILTVLLSATQEEQDMTSVTICWWHLFAPLGCQSLHTLHVFRKSAGQWACREGKA